MPSRASSTALRSAVMTLRPLLLLLALSGCTAAGVVAESIPDPKVAAAYKGLAGQSIGVMVWVDRAAAIDHPNIQIDAARDIQSKLQEAADANIDEVKGVRFAAATQIIRFQEAHPELEIDAADEVATKLPVAITRLIYVEIDTFALRSNDSVDLMRGSATANIKVVEIKQGQGKIAYEEQGISVVYPKNSPPEGTPGLAEEDVYQQTIDSLTSEICKRFVSHESDVE